MQEPLDALAAGHDPGADSGCADRPASVGRTGLTAAIVLCLGLGLGCASIVLSQAPRFRYFQPPDPGDPWSAKIEGWQRRERAEQAALFAGLPAVAEAPLLETSAEPVGPSAVGSTPDRVRGESDSLRSKYESFRAERKRETAREFALWIQSQAKLHYVPDGPIDHWATLEETLRADGDDCDGLELLTFQGLRDLGFSDSEVFRSIVYRPSDGQHHMVTLWFEDPDDPWVIDPTGAMTVGMPRMSDLPAWVPLKVFGESTEFTVRRRTIEPHTALAAHP